MGDRREVRAQRLHFRHLLVTGVEGYGEALARADRVGLLLWYLHVYLKDHALARTTALTLEQARVEDVAAL